jgi:hypothetical protein
MKVSGVRLAVGMTCAVTLGVVVFSASKQERERPRIVMHPRMVDLGTLTQGSQASASFSVFNKGTGTLIVTGVTGSCACTAALASVASIPAGGQGRIDVTLDTNLPLPVDEPIARSVRVTSNDPVEPLIDLTLKLVVEPEFDLSRTVVELGTVVQGDTRLDGVLVRTRTGRAAIVLAGDSADGKIRVGMRRASDRETSFEIDVLPTAPLGEYFGVIRVRTTSEHRPLIRIPVHGVIGAVLPK